MLIFRQLFDAASSTYTYLLGDSDSGEAVLIDPVFENVRRDLALLRELGLRLVATLDTHVHADHRTRGKTAMARTAANNHKLTRLIVPPPGRRPGRRGRRGYIGSAG